MASSDDLRKAALYTLIPGTASLVGGFIFYSDKSIQDYWKGLKKPTWACPSYHVYGIMDVATSIPTGCAAFMVHKYGNFTQNDTKAAFVAFGITMASGFASMLLFAKNRDLKHCFYLNTLMLTSSVATTGLFYKIHQQAGWLMVPFTLWIAYGVAFLHELSVLNPKKVEKNPEFVR